MKFSILVITYNCAPYIERFLNELISSLSQTDQVEILINDNDSTDRTPDLCQQWQNRHPDIIKFYQSENIGFAKANNKLIKNAAYDNILLLNPDVFGFSVNFWERVFKIWDKTNPFLVRLYNEDGSIQSTVGDEISILRMIKSAFKLYVDPSFQNSTGLIEIQSGIMAFVLLSRESLDKVGLLSEDYHMYGEDHDWFIRARRAKYTPFYYTESTLIHVGGASAGTRWKKKEELNVKFHAQKLLIKKNFKGGKRALLMLALNLKISMP